MVYCVAWGCTSNSSSRPGVPKFEGSWHAFPKEQALRKQWIARLSRQHYEWKPAHRLCSRHFTDGDYVIDPGAAVRMGYRIGKLYLKPGALPSVNLTPRTTQVDAGPAPKKSRRMAHVKRSNLQVIAEHEQAAHRGNDSLVAEPTPQDTEAALPPPPPPHVAAEPEPATCSKMTQASPITTHLISKASQCCIDSRPSRASKPCQTDSKLTKPCSSRGVQTDTPKPVMVDAAVHCTLLCPPVEEESDVDSEREEDPGSDVDPNYEPDSEAELCEDELIETCDDMPVGDNQIFMVFGSCLRMLLSICLVCRQACRVTIRRTMGAGVVFHRLCTVCGWQGDWTSQPLSGRGMALGNLKLAAGIFYSGCCPVQALNFLHSINIKTITIRTYNRLQRAYLVPSVIRVWRRHQSSFLEVARQTGTKLFLSGDARCDSPGHNAKYGTYSLMDMATGRIIMQKLVQVSEVTSSQAMEKEGLVRCLEELHDEGLDVEGIVTDRHPSVKKYLRLQNLFATMRHYFDIWHIAKGIKKKIAAVARKKPFRELSDWVAAIVNHLYYSALTSGGDEEVVQAKYLSLLNHVCNVHEGHGSVFPKCLHGPLGEQEQRRWLRSGSPAFKSLRSILTQQLLMKDIGKMSPHAQTSSLEAFHSVLCLFAPKSTHFFYNTMEARCLLAALHFNENTRREQCGVEEGRPQWVASYPKHRDGDGSIKPVKTPVTFRYVQELVDEAELLRNEYPSYRKAEQLVQAGQRPITHNLGVIDKEVLLRRHQSRFGHRPIAD